MKDKKIIDAISIVVDTIKSNEDDLNQLFSCKKEQLVIADFFDCSEDEAVIISILFVLNCQDGAVTLNDLSRFSKCNTIKSIQQINILKNLQNRGIVCFQRGRYRRNGLMTNMEYYLEQKIVDAIINNTELPALKSKENFDIYQLLESIYRLAQEREDGNLNSADLLKETERHIKQGAHFKLIKNIAQLDLPVIEQYILIYCYWKYLIGEDRVSILETFNEIYDNSYDRVRQMQQLVGGKSLLITKGFIEIVDGHFTNESNFKLSNSALDMLKEEGIMVYSKTSSKKNNHILPEDIIAKTLFYNEDEKRQINLLREALDENNFNKLQKRLAEKGLNNGAAILLHGPPGTGKTESVLQFAKSTGRQIMKVDISSTKSMWFGESQKLIKRVFNDYRNYSRYADKCPILFFNEADAVISKRKDSISSNTAQTENAIQNILLEEMENFNGIMFATTNLVANLDKAFERRFLFKIELKQPNASNRAAIWKDKINYLGAEEALSLAARYNFSGGQIDNILKKVELNYVLHEAYPNFNEIIDYCESELLSGMNTKKVGFDLNN